MFVNQRRQRDVSQNIAAVGNERIAAQLEFDIFDSAAGFEQNRFVDKLECFPRIMIFRKRLREHFREPVGVDENLFNADVDQMIESKSDQRLLKNRNERFRQFIGQRPQACSKTGAEDECLFDSRHGVTNPEWRKNQFGVAMYRSGKTSVFSFSKLCLPPQFWRSSSGRGAVHRPKSEILARTF